MLLLLLLKVSSERCGGLPIGAVMLNKLVCVSDGYRLAFALLRIRLSSLDAMRILQDKKPYQLNFVQNCKSEICYLKKTKKQLAWKGMI